jgi:nucleoid DNA-binding protein
MAVENSVDKIVLRRYVNKKINKAVHSIHVFSIINILFEEMQKRLVNGEVIKIHNLGEFSFTRTKPGRLRHVITHELITTEGRMKMGLKLMKRIRSKICQMLDLDITYPPKDNEN